MTTTPDRSTTREQGGTRDDPPTRVPDGEEPAATCDRCGRPFPTVVHHDLHLGEAHADDLTGAERERFEEARDDETDELFVYHLKVIAALGSLYAVFVLVYMVVLSL